MFSLSDELFAVLKTRELSRGDVLKKIWDYIKTQNLQNPKNKREIIPDKKLEKVFGNKEPIDMMQLAKILSNHLHKK